MKILKILSGGQTGADTGALLAAQELGFPTGGYAPVGWRTEEGPRPWLACYGLEEAPAAGNLARDYAHRTTLNVVNADAVLVFGDPTSAGSRLTLQLAAQHGVPGAILHWRGGGIATGAGKLRAWVEQHGGRGPASWPRELLVAGNRESRNPGIEAATRELLLAAFADWRQPPTVVAHHAVVAAAAAAAGGTDRIVSIMRPGPFGNPIVAGRAGDAGRPCPGCGRTAVHTRAAAIACHRGYFWRRLAVDAPWRQQVAALRGATLTCGCAPMACHGDVIAAWINGAVQPEMAPTAPAELL